MLIVTGQEMKKFPLPPAGTHQAVCYGVWDLKWQMKLYQGKQSYQHKCLIGWEINEPSDDGKRFKIHQRFTHSLGTKANLRKVLVSWRGKEFTEEELKGFDLHKLVGVNCMLTIVHNAKGVDTFANVSSVGKLMKGFMPLLPETPAEPTPDWIVKIQGKGLDEDPAVKQTPGTEEGADNTEQAVEAPEEEIPF